MEVCFEDNRRVLYALKRPTISRRLLHYGPRPRGEYPAVVLFLPQHYMMLQRNVLYTAITRKRMIVIVGSGKAVAMAVHNSNIMQRNTSLADRLRNVL